jgi:dephospho-CoA kinase
MKARQQNAKHTEPVHLLRPLPGVKVVGVSASGKSTLVQHLRLAGYNARPVSQEHSDILTLWKEFDIPKVLIYLDVDLETQRRRRPDVVWSEAVRQQEIERLAHARANADLQIDTSALSTNTVYEIALSFLQTSNIRFSPEPLPALAATGAAQASPRRG